MGVNPVTPETLLKIQVFRHPSNELPT
jgi:hypothetical protein